MDPEKDEKGARVPHEENGTTNSPKPAVESDDGDEVPPPNSYPPIVEYDD